MKDVQEINKNHLGAISLTLAILSDTKEEDDQQELIEKLLKFGATGQRLWEIYLYFFQGDEEQFCETMRKYTEKQMEIIFRNLTNLNREARRRQ
ncbi:MAG TPA: hypothetical protein PLF59_08300 [Cyclobacteriaceae bacterium]|nr:hypothetical protein [Cyclobacteriaceae bacterium]